MSTKKILFFIHIASVLITCLNAIVDSYTKYRLANYIALSIKIISFLTGLILFFYYAQTVKKRKFYFGTYVFTAIFAIPAMLSNDMLNILYVITIFYFFLPDKSVYKDDDRIVYSQVSFIRYKGDNFSVRRDLHIVEEDLGSFNLSYDKEWDIKNMRILNDSMVIVPNKKLIRYDNFEMKMDTINLKRY